MCGFVIGGPWLEENEALFREYEGLTEILKPKQNLWILVFRARESAICAQWQMELQGAKGIDHGADED